MDVAVQLGALVPFILVFSTNKVQPEKTSSCQDPPSSCFSDRNHQRMFRSKLRFWVCSWSKMLVLHFFIYVVVYLFLVLVTIFGKGYYGLGVSMDTQCWLCRLPFTLQHQRLVEAMLLIYLFVCLLTYSLCGMWPP